MVCSQHRHHNTLLRLRISGGLNQEASNTSIPYRWQGSVRLSTLVPGGLNKGLRRVLCDSLVSYMRQWRTLPRNQMSRASDGFGGLLMSARCLVVAQSALSRLKKLRAHVSVVGVASARCWTTANTMHSTHR
jgi:hypothetical protein